MNLLELYRVVDEEINRCITHYREHKSSAIIESDVRDILMLYINNGLIEAFHLSFEQNTFDVSFLIRLQLSNLDSELQTQQVPIELKYTFNSESNSDIMSNDRQAMYEKLERMLESIQH